MFRFALLTRFLYLCGWGGLNDSFGHQVGKKEANGNQLSGTGSASATLVCEISEIVVDMTTGNVLRTDNGYIIRMEPSQEIAVYLYGMPESLKGSCPVPAETDPVRTLSLYVVSLLPYCNYADFLFRCQFRFS